MISSLVEVIGWVGYFFTLIGIVMMVVKQVTSLKMWIVFLISNVFWITCDVLLGGVASGARNITLLISNILGLWQWHRLRIKHPEEPLICDEGKWDVLCFDFEEEFNQMPEWERKLTIKYVVNVGELEKQGKTPEVIEQIIDETRKYFFMEYNEKKRESEKK